MRGLSVCILVCLACAFSAAADARPRSDSAVPAKAKPCVRTKAKSCKPTPKPKPKPKPKPAPPRPVPPPTPPPRDTTPPSVAGAEIAGSELRVTFSEPVFDAFKDRFSVGVDGWTVAPTGATIDGSVVVLTVDPTTYSASTVDLTVAAAAVHDAAGNQAAVATAVPVTNRSAAFPSAALSGGCSPSLAAAPGSSADLTEAVPADFSRSIRPAGAVSALAILVDYADAPASADPSAYAGGAFSTANSWFSSVSGGRMALNTTLTSHWFRMPRPAAVYGTLPIRELIGDALAAADPEINFNQYSLVYVVSAPSVDLANSIGGDGVQLTTSMFTPDGSRIEHFIHATAFPPLGLSETTIEHETGHAFGLPDLYVYKPGLATLWYVGTWDLMSSSSQGVPSTMLAWQRWRLGWLNPGDLRCLDAPGTLEDNLTTAEVAGGAKAIVVKISPTFAYVVEARRGTPLNRCRQGVIVYTVDSTIGTSQGPVRVLPSGKANCPLNPAPFDVGPDDVAHFSDDAITVDVTAHQGPTYRVRVTRR